tara:strand:- start:929 stop:1102 length:174 start_codon:yes stop_codon:yes gene_type:complete
METIESLKTKLDELVKQQENTRSVFLKLQGAIEFTEGLINQAEEKKDDKTVAKKTDK